MLPLCVVSKSGSAIEDNAFREGRGTLIQEMQTNSGMKIMSKSTLTYGKNPNQKISRMPAGKNPNPSPLQESPVISQYTGNEPVPVLSPGQGKSVFETIDPDSLLTFTHEQEKWVNNNR